MLSLEHAHLSPRKYMYEIYLILILCFEYLLNSDRLNMFIFKNKLS